MAQILLFHSALGVRAGITALEDVLCEAGHDVTVVDQYEGRTYDSYDEAMAHVDAVGMPALMHGALGHSTDVPGRFVAVGFSNGACMAQYVAAKRPKDARGVVMIGGGVPMRILDLPWPKGVPGQIHVTKGDPWSEPEANDEVVADAEQAGGHVELFTYPGDGHLFNDEQMPDEYQPAEAELLHERVVEFISRLE